MGKLVHLTNGSLDLLIDDQRGSLDWRAPSDELFVHRRNLIRPLGPHLYGWQLFEATAPSERSPELAAQSDLTAAESTCTAAAPRETSR